MAVLAYVTELLEKAGYPLVFILSVLEGGGLPVPLGILLILAGTMSAKGSLEGPAVVALFVAGNVLGNLALFRIGAMGKERLILRRFGKRLERGELLTTLADLQERWGSWTLFLVHLFSRTIRPLVILANSASGPAGRSFILFALAGNLLWGGFWLITGYTAKVGQNILIDMAVEYGIVVAVTLGILVVTALALLVGVVIRGRVNGKG